MKMIETRLIALFCWLALAALPLSSVNAQNGQNSPPQLKLTVSADREDAQYQVGETATFVIHVQQNGEALKEGEVVCVLSQDGWKPLPAQKVKVVDGKATLTGKLDHPGFLLLRANIEKANALGAVGFDPLKIEPSMPVPDDFDEFWAAQKGALAQVPVRSTLTPVESPLKGTEAFDVQVDCLDKAVTGYFARPEKAKPKSLPAILFVHGAGVRSSNLANTQQWALREGGLLAMDINAHGIPNGQEKEFYDALAKGELNDYRGIGRENREESYFKGMFLRMLRAIDFLTSQPEWDGKTLVVYGSSQGGFQALAAAGLDSRVSFICAGVPAGCDHTGNVVDRISGWPKLVPFTAQGTPNPRALEASRYVDCVNFATRAKCKGAVITVGFIDTVCPPTSIYAAYNVLPIPKAIHIDVDAGHTNTPAANRFMQEAAYKHIREMKSSQ